MTYNSLLSDFAVVISSIRGFILASVRLFLQMLNVKEYEDQFFSNLEILLLYTLYKKTIDAMVVGLLQGGHKC